MSPSVFLTGFSLGLSLILAIGAQNAFVLRQGLRGEHVFAVVLTCALADAVLILVGVTSFRQISALLPWLDPVMRYGGAAFLGAYALRSLYSAFTSTASLSLDQAPVTGPLLPTFLTALALTFLNPHVYLDTVVLVGTISARYPEATSSFAAGAMTASFVFFFSLGFGARWLRPLFARPLAWRILDGVIAIVMALIAVRLVMDA